MLVRFVDVAGVKTRCLIAGKEGNYPILFVHGMTYAADIWMRNVDDLGRDHYVVAADMLGHGFTNPGRPLSKPSIPQKVDHVCALADTLGFDKFCLSGSSYGALIAVLAYFKMRDRIDRLIINGSGSAFNTEEELAPYMERTFNNVYPNLANSTREMWRQALSKPVFDPKTIPEELLYIAMNYFAQPWLVAAWEQSMRDLMDIEVGRPYRILHRLEEIAVKTMVVWGRQDPGAVYQSAVDAVSRMPDAHLETIENCGHMIMFEQPDEYNKIVRKFLAR
jgi:2-hydroxy-6-oxonona-2,4-dienedioate hydrolase